MDIRNIDEVVLRYINLLEERGLVDWVKKIFPSSRRLEELARFTGLPMGEAVSLIAEELTAYIHPEAAAEALGVPLEAARLILARKIALWHFQLAEELGIIRLK